MTSIKTSESDQKDLTLDELFERVRGGDQELTARLKTALGPRALAKLMVLDTSIVDPNLIKQILIDRAEALKGEDNPLDVDPDFWYIVLAFATLGLGINLSEHEDLQMPIGYTEVYTLIVSLPDTVSLITTLKHVLGSIKRTRVPKDSLPTNTTVKTTIPDEFPN
jgi:hypothetical protein